MVPVYGNSISQADVLGAVDKMFNTLFTFTASGSGWISEKCVELDVDFAIFNRICGPSNLATPTELDASRILLNIRNHQDHICFLYCFLAAWHLKHGPLLYVAGRETVRNRTRQPLFSRSNPLAHQAEGDFDISMASIRCFDSKN